MELGGTGGILQLFIYDSDSVTLHEGWTHVKEVTNTELFVSVHHTYDTFAHLQVFDVSSTGRAKKIYSATRVSGGRIIIN